MDKKIVDTIVDDILSKHGKLHSSRAAEFNGCDHCEIEEMIREAIDRTRESTLMNLVEYAAKTQPAEIYLEIMNCINVIQPVPEPPAGSTK